MKPELNDFKILNMFQTYFVLDPFDLYVMPAFKIVSKGYQDIKEAENHRQRIFEKAVAEYEYLKKLGRGFPDND